MERHGRIRKSASFRGALTSTAILALVASIIGAELGDSRDKAGTVQTPIIPQELIPPSPVLPPSEALKSLQLAAPDLKIELVASEPLVGDPVAINIGPDGRMWVVEMRSYMPNLDGIGEDEPTGNIVTLEDTNGDGVMDKRVVFQDQLVMPRAVMPVGNGALIGAPPFLWYCVDKDGDGKADERTVVANDFGMAASRERPELANPERAPNSLLWALDNWIYSSAYTKRFRFVGGQWLNGPTTFRGQYGLSQDNEGRLYYNSNSDQLRVDILPSHYMGRNPFASPVGGTNVNPTTDQFVWPARVTPALNRGYMPEVLRGHKLKAFTAGCSPWIYRGGLLGAEYENNAFVCEPAGNLVKRNITASANGTLSAKEAYMEKEFLASTDERFRPVFLYTGPEGALYVVDFHRGLLEHRTSLTTYLRKQSEDRGLDKPIGLGRIYRILPKNGAAPTTKPYLHRQSPDQWIAHLSSPNSWWRETAQRLLVEAGGDAQVEALKAAATQGTNPLGRVHALWTLDGLGRTDTSTLIHAIEDADPRVRTAAVRLSEPILKTGEKRDQIRTLLIQLSGKEADSLVQQQLVLTLGEAASEDTDFAMTNLLARAGDTAFLKDAALSGLALREWELLERISESDPCQHPNVAMKSFMSGLARSIMMSRRSGPAEKLLDLILRDEPRSEFGVALLEGVLASAPAMIKKPIKLGAKPALLDQLDKNKDARHAKLGAMILWPGKPGVPPEIPIPALSASEQDRFTQGKLLYTAICMACHQQHGMGMEGLAPPLVDSEWVLGSEQRLARIVMHGLTGPVKVQGRTYNLDMPPLGVLNDDQIASVLTYIRREWEHGASPVTPEAIKTIRDTTGTRSAGWRQDELLLLP